MQKSTKKLLLKQAQQLKPVVMIGGKGLTEAVHAEIEIALEAHELIKIKINADDQIEKQEMLDVILQQNQAELVQSIGYVAVIYRKRSK